MSTKTNEPLGPPIASKHELVEWFAAGEKPRERWLIGTEHEKFPFRCDDLSSVPYEGPAGIGRLMELLAQRFDWTPINENGKVIALSRPGSLAMVSLEPGGQFELSGAPMRTLHETRTELMAHLDEVRTVAEGLGMRFSGLGFAPSWRLDEVASMPKQRYAIMRRYMQQVGTRGLDMMYRTATVQVNLDFATEADMVKKMRVAMALQPVVSALFVNSPFREKAPTGMLSNRCHTWLDTDSARCGVPAFVFESGMGYERYADYALDVPMYFVYRDGKYIDVAGESFRDFLQGRLPQLPGELPRLSDWADHLSTLFPEVRLKRYLEMRGADAGGPDHLCALPALWVGLLYDTAALDACWDLVKAVPHEEIEEARRRVPAEGLRAPFGKRMVLDVAREILELAHGALRRRKLLDEHGRDETMYLRSAEQAATTGLTPAEVLLRRCQKEWNGDAGRALQDTAL
ncbi:glutamate--cysteine ligase [Chromobacterium vaccinii]|uniref:glutamate--cysteine ligase n=1 Tax=Chromobacterium vaccinii TaxID=1108595 RepID=UPI003C78BE01